ncbi:MAG: tetratricopeptide repeat protein [Chloroflexota bacterium]|nr:tetratricopeptide repeat protein [Chloroflexota bacterium]MDQ5867556.1 tetratricopeptide repeat protein [Chloroflexota bacterium]
MSASQYDDTIKTLGQFIREARLARGLSLEELGEPELSGNYVDALERGAVLPSHIALEALARHFVVPVTELLQVQAKLETEPDLRAIEEDLHLQLDYAKPLIDKHRTEEALELINKAEQSVLPYMEHLSWQARYRIPYLRGRAYLPLGKLAEGQTELEMALLQVGPHLETVARVRNLLGVAYYLQGQPQRALLEHKEGLRAAEDGMVKDLNLRLSICRNLANAHWALNHFEEAIRFNKESLRVLQNLHDVKPQARVYWGMMMAYRALRDRTRAKLCGLKALEIYEAEGDVCSIASICVNLAEMNIEDGQYEDALQMLERSKKLLKGEDEEILMGILYQDFARLARALGQLDEAAEYARQGIKLGEAGCHKIPIRDMQARGTALRSYADALHVAAQIEEARHNPDVADKLFSQAIATIEQTSFEETRSEIIYSYAEALKGRGEHERAGEYYRMSYQLRQGARPVRV